jgi:MoaA/NifB/PqqE/SkfB family radical SAM enzyme
MANADNSLAMRNWFPLYKNIKFQANRISRRLFPRDYTAALNRTANCPPILSIETTNACNARCVFCGYRFMQRPKCIMDFDLYKKAVDDYADCGGRSIGLAVTVGEPLLDPLLPERIAYGKSRGLRGFGFFTNGILLHKIDLRSLLSSGLGALHISISGFDRQTYRQTYGVDSYPQVIENLCALAELNNSMGGRVRLSVSVKSPIPVRRLVRSEDYKKLIALGLPVSFAVRYDNWSGRIQEKDMAGCMRLRPVPRKRRPCSMLWFGATVHADGNFTLCGCRDLEGDTELAIGNIGDKSIRELWTSPRVREIRERFLVHTPDICRDCAQYTSISDIGDSELSLIPQ